MSMSRFRSIYISISMNRQTERQRDRATERQRDRETERQRDRLTDRQTDRQIDDFPIFDADFP